MKNKIYSKTILVGINFLIVSLSFGQSSTIYQELTDSIKVNTKESKLIAIRDRIKDKSEYSKANDLIISHYPNGQAATATYLRNDITKVKRRIYSF